jgi:hypothetical protein
MEASIIGTQVRTVDPKYIAQAVEIRVTNHGTRARHYSVADFSADTGSLDFAIGSEAVTDHTMLTGGNLNPGQSVTGWLEFTFPRTTGLIEVNWEDQFHLEPPVVLARYAVR